MKKIIIIFLLVVFGFGTWFWLKKENTLDVAKEGPRKIAYWVAPMDPKFRRDAPGKSPMGMDLIPVYEDEMNGGDNSNAVKLSPAVINNLGVRTARVEKGSFRRQIETVGYIGYDETKIGHVHARAEGWIEKIYVYSVGQKIKKGDVLFEIYSPAIVNAQSEYLQALNTGSVTLIRASAERLRAFGLIEEQISEIKNTRQAGRLVKVFSHHDGVITMLSAAHGMYVKPENMIVQVADLSAIWLLVDVFEAQSSWVKQGLPAEVRLSYEPGRVWSGKIAYVYPQIDPKTRTLKARLEFENPGEGLKPDMYAAVTIKGEEKPNTLMIPQEALIRTGKTERVILALGEGRFQPAQVKSGVESGDKIEILEGLSEGEEIVISAQFLIDSEASFTGSSLRMSAHQGDERQDISGATFAPAAEATGTINKVMPDENKVNITHGPIKELGWPDMTMDFLISPEINPVLMKEGVKVRFKLIKSPEGGYQIIEMENIP